jgi:amidophosphoribosyltransferase
LQQGVIAATGQPVSRLCTACFHGKYLIELPRERPGKNVIEHMLANATRAGMQTETDDVSALRRR